MTGVGNNSNTIGDTFRRIEVLTGPERRRRWTLEEKYRIVSESYAPGARVSAVARRSGLHPNRLVTWRRQFHEGRFEGGGADLPPFVPVVVGSGALPGETGSGAIEVAAGGMTVRLTADVDAGVLRKVLGVVREFA